MLVVVVAAVVFVLINKTPLKEAQVYISIKQIKNFLAN